VTPARPPHRRRPNVVRRRPKAVRRRPKAVRSVEVVLVDAFTATPFTGNPAAVVPDATGLDEAAMRAIAAEMARPATAFLQRAAPDGTRGLRWFSPAGLELTLCGHGTVAAAHVLAARDEVPEGRLVFAAPRHRLAITLQNGTAWFEPDCPRWKPEADDLAPFLAALGLPARAVAQWAPPARTSEQDLLIPVTGLAALGALAPDLAAVGRLARARGVRGVVLTAREVREPDGHALTHSRIFVPHFGIPEDFATGSSHAAIGVWLWETEGLPAGNGVARFRGEQGDFPGRPGRIAVEVHGAPGRATRVRVGGQAVIVLTGQLSLP
jgi:PhzF family phenazine biosynthesis protein